MEIQNVFQLIELINLSDDDLLNRLQVNRLLSQSMRCSVRSCRRHCTIQKRKTALLGHCFWCSRCKTRYSILNGSFFEKCRVPIRTVLYLLWQWVCEIRSGCAAMSVGCSKVVAVQYYRYFRDICSWQLVQRNDLFLFGGEGHIVQIDESVLTRRKYNVERVIPERWVLGMYDVTERRGYVVFVQDRSATTLEALISEHVLPGTEVWTDCCREYGKLMNLGGVSPYIHKMVNRSRHFVDPDTRVCINHIKGHWSCLKQFLRRLGVMQSNFLPEYMDQFMWWQVFGPTPSARFANITAQISARYPLT